METSSSHCNTANQLRLGFEDMKPESCKRFVSLPTSVEPDILHSRESVPAWKGRHCRCHLPILTPSRQGTPPVPLRPLGRFRGPRWRSAGGFRAGWRQGVVVLVKCPWDLIKGARRGGKVIIVWRALVAVHGGEGVAGSFEGIHLLVLKVRVAEAAMRWGLRTVTPRKNVAGLL